MKKICYEENENTGKNILYKIYFPKIRLQLTNADTFLGGAMYVSLSKRKNEIGSIVSELNPTLWKTGILPQTL